MKSTIIATGFAAMLLAACSTTTADLSDEAKARAAEEELMASGDEVDMDEVVCRKQQITGSRFGRDVCMTRQQWEDAAKAGGDPIGASQRRALQYSPPGG